MCFDFRLFLKYRLLGRRNKLTRVTWRSRRTCDLPDPHPSRGCFVYPEGPWRRVRQGPGLLCCFNFAPRPIKTRSRNKSEEPAWPSPALWPQPGKLTSRACHHPVRWPL